MSRFTAASVLALAAFAAPAAGALDFGSGFSLTGDVELEYLRSDGDDTTLGFVDATLGWRSQGGGALTFGADVTLVAAEILDSGGDGVNRIWGGLVLGTSFGDVTVGSPRPLMDSLSRAPDIGLSRTLEFELSTLLAPSLLGTLALIQSDVDVIGVAFEGEANGFSYGLALHEASSGGSEDARVTELTLGYSLGATDLYAGIERISSGGSTGERVLLGARYAAERWTLGAEHLRLSQGSSSVSLITVYGDYMVIDGLRLGAQVRDLGDFSSSTLYGLSTEYSFGSGGFANLGYVTADSDGFSDVVNASLGFRF